MRQSLVCQSAKALQNIIKTKARRAARAIPPTTEYVEFDSSDGTRHVALPRTLSLSSTLREKTQNSLEALLSTRGALYQTVWESFLVLRDIVDRQGGPPIPRNILEAVLRQCTPTWHALRHHAIHPTTEYGALKRLQNPLPHEPRLRSVLQYMKKSNQPPTEEDFHFILQQMAAVGHVRGAASVLEEMEATKGVKPSIKTFKHILRACVYLMESPLPPEVQSHVSNEVTTLASQAVQRMQNLNVELDAPIVELLLRIFKEQQNTEACEHILRLACSFDVRRPDRMPEEFEKRLKDADTQQAQLPLPVPITTSMLTTLMKLYGSQGDIPKMITAFEVLTNPYPLPSNLPSPQSDWWDADDEYDVANPVIQTPLKHRPEYVWEPPKSSPNTATLDTIIRYLAWARQRMLCEHYMLLAEEYDKAESVRLRNELSKELKSLDSVSSMTNPDRMSDDTATLAGPGFIVAPRFHVTSHMFHPVFVYANQARLTELMRWMQQHLRTIIWRREDDLDFFKKSYDALPPLTIPLGAEVRLNSRHQLYVDYSAIAKGPEVAKPLDLQFHIKLVESTLASFRTMLRRADEVVARLSQRTVERMTRRVWKHQDVFLSDVGQRTMIGRGEWSARIKWRDWDGPVTAAGLGQRSTSNAEGEAPAPSRWMDTRLKARIKAIKDSPDTQDAPDDPK